MRVVATCTTLPGRYDTLYRALKTIKPQVDKIYITIPYVAKRLGIKYPEIPKKISNIATIIRIDTDYGPLCKLYGALYCEHDPNTIIISIDDDSIYHPKLVSFLLSYHKKYPNVAITGTGALLKNGLIFSSIYRNDAGMENVNIMNGFNIPEQGRYVDLVHGYSGVLYKRSFFPTKNNLNDLFKYPLLDDNVFCHDDIIISGYLNKNNIRIKTFANTPSLPCEDEKKEDALSYDFIKMVFKFDKAITFLKQYGMFLHYEDTELCESPTMRGIILFLFVVFLIIFVYIIYKYYC